MFYTKHIFFCTNRKENGQGCGSLTNDDGFMWAKRYLQQLNLWGAGKLRASRAGCLGRCEAGPVCVIYPQGIWYSYCNEDDVTEIIEQSMLKDNTVARLLI